MINKEPTMQETGSTQVAKAPSRQTVFSVARVAGGVGGVLTALGCAFALFIIFPLLQVMLSLFGLGFDIYKIWDKIDYWFERMS